MKKYVFILVIIGFVSAQDYQAMGDSTYNIFENEKALEYYLQAETNNQLSYDLSWKIARTYLDLGQDAKDEKRAELFKKGEEYARKAIELNPDGAQGHLQLSIALGRVALDASAKERIRMSKEIKQEVDKAINLDPQNDIAYHVLGRWNRKIANLSWIEKGFANMFLGGIPEGASNESALNSFKKAIELNPDHINHYLELGITYQMMDDDKNAIAAFQKCIDLPVKDSDDPEYKEKAQEYLNDLQ